MFVALTPNLSLDRVLTLDRPLTPGRLHRVPTLHVAAGGKGVNLARVIRALGGRSVVAGFIAGFNGQRFQHLLQQEGLESVLVRAEGETRECHILLETHGTSGTNGAHGAHPTELNEMGFEVPDDLWESLLRQLPSGEVAVCGSLPPGCTREQFARVLRSVKAPVVDSSGMGLEVALDCRASLIKPNEHELRHLTGSDTLEAARDLHTRTGVTVLLTLGERGAAYVGRQVWQATAPSIQVNNPVGSGDSFLAGFLHAAQGGAAPPEALRMAVACGTANAMLGGPLQFNAATAHDLARRVQVTQWQGQTTP